MQNAERCKTPLSPRERGVGGEAEQHDFCYAPTELYQILKIHNYSCYAPYRAGKQMSWAGHEDKATAWRHIDSIAGTKANKLRRSVTI
jgi:hypothetical protein